MINRLIALILLISLFSTSVFADYSIEDIEKLQNDKEPISTELSKKEIQKIKELYTSPEINNEIKKVIFNSILDYVNQKSELKCELKLPEILISNLTILNFKHDEKSIEEYLKLMRVENKIDDIFYTIFSDLNKDFHNIQKINRQKSKKPTFSVTKKDKLLENNNIDELFSSFKTWPDGSESCVFNEFYSLSKDIKNSKGKLGKKRSLKKLIKIALQENIITTKTYNKLNYLQSKSKYLNRDIWLQEYLEIIFNAKNQMVPLNYTYDIQDISNEDQYTMERVKRLKKLTRRRLLFRKYNATQIVMISQILQKASQRMGTDPDTVSGNPVISQDFSVLQPDGSRKNYVEKIELTTQEQYNLARKLLRRDMTTLQMMDTFTGRNLTYDDVVLAAFETGYISFEDIEHVLMYDDLWNPNETRFEKVMSFIFTVTGFATFYIPPPWNATAAIALTIVQGLISNRNLKGSDNDNPASIID